MNLKGQTSKGKRSGGNSISIFLPWNLSVVMHALEIVDES